MGTGGGGNGMGGGSGLKPGPFQPGRGGGKDGGGT